MIFAATALGVGIIPAEKSELLAREADGQQVIASGKSATGNRCMVATVHPLATDAGVDAFRAGGNAIDAAIAAAFTLGVVDNHNSGLGGGCFILLRLADGEIVAIDGREKAPAAAHRDMYLRDGRPDTSLSQTGPLAVGVPGALQAYQLAVEEYGQRSLADLLLPAADIAENGFPIDRVYARKLSDKAQELSRFEGSSSVLLKPDGTAFLEGETLKQHDLANSYRQIAEHGVDWFYGGPFAKTVDKWMAEHGGILTAADFAGYEARRRTPIESQYQGYTVVGFPPPSSGGVHVAQILNMLDQFELSSLHEKNPASVVHVMAEAMKLAFADRAYWLGDADFVKVPLGLIDRTYTDKLAARIQLGETIKVPGHGFPPHWQTNVFEKHTTHIAAADAEGNWVAITATVNTAFGSKVIVPGTGIVLNNEMDDFSIHPGTPNAFGLVGAENNAIAPGKRPLSSMSPTIVLDSRRQPVLTVGAAGGPRIITQVVSTIVNHLELGMTLAESVSAPRFHHQWLPDHIRVESTVPPAILKQLRMWGHELKIVKYAGITQAIARDKNGSLIGVNDPRAPGKASGY